MISCRDHFETLALKKRPPDSQNQDPSCISVLNRIFWCQNDTLRGINKIRKHTGRERLAVCELDAGENGVLYQVPILHFWVPILAIQIHFSVQ